MKVGGIILCGGRSSRMGRAKAWLPFDDEAMLQRVVRILRTVVDPIVVVAAPGQEIPTLPADVIIARDPEEGRGPLQGLAAGLASAPSLALQAFYLSSCDVPFLQPSFIQRMIELLGENAIAVPDVDGYKHPLAAVYRVSVKPVVDELLAANRLRPVFLFEKCPTRLVTAAELVEADPTLQSLRNLNTPEEYEAAIGTLNRKQKDS